MHQQSSSARRDGYLEFEVVILIDKLVPLFLELGPQLNLHLVQSLLLDEL